MMTPSPWTMAGDEPATWQLLFDEYLVAQELRPEFDVLNIFVDQGPIQTVIVQIVCFDLCQRGFFGGLPFPAIYLT